MKIDTELEEIVEFRSLINKICRHVPHRNTQTNDMSYDYAIPQHLATNHKVDNEYTDNRATLYKY